MFLCHNIWQQHFKIKRTVNTFHYFTEEWNSVWGGGGGGVGALNNLQYVLESVDGYRPGKVWKKHPL